MASVSTDKYTTEHPVCQEDLTLASQIRTVSMVRSDIMTELTELLSVELGRQRMSMRELGRLAGFSATQVSDVLSEKAPASAEFVISTAYALGKDPVDMLRLSGHLRTAPSPTSLDDEVLDHFRRLHPHQQAYVADLLSDLAGISRPDRRAVGEEAAYPTIRLDPAAPMIDGDVLNSELDQALEQQLVWMWQRFPKEERAALFTQAAVAFALRMEEQEQQNQT